MDWNTVGDAGVGGSAVSARGPPPAMIGDLTLTDRPSSLHPFRSSSPAAAATAGPIPHSSPASLLFVRQGTRPLRFASGLNQPKGSTRNRAATARRSGGEIVARDCKRLRKPTLVGNWTEGR